MQNLEHAENCELKKQRIADMLEQLILDTILSVLDELLDRNNRAPYLTCHKLECPEREREPF